MSGAIESTILPLAEGSMIDQTLDLIIAVKTELILFCLAFVFHQLIFGRVFPKAVKFCRGNTKLDSASPWDSLRRVLGTHPSVQKRNEESLSGSEALRWSQQAFERGDHRAVLRLWNSLRRSDEVPVGHLAQVLETMRRLKKDTTSILAEVEGYLSRNKNARHISFVNALMEPVAKSLDAEVVTGILELLKALDIKLDSQTYEMLLQMSFTTRNFQEVKRLADDMEAKELVPTARASLILLKASLQAGNLDESLKRFQELSVDAAVPTASQAPMHIMTHLVELACREGRVDAVLTELDTGRIPLSAEMVNTMLGEGNRLKDNSITEHVRKLVASQRVELNSRSFQHLIRGAGDDRQKIFELLKEMQANGIECLQDVVSSVLSVCTSLSDVKLANQLYELVGKHDSSHGHTRSAFVRFYSEAGEAEKACFIYDELLASSRNDNRLNLDSKTEKSLISAALQCGRKDIASKLVESSPSDTAKHINMIRNSASKGNLTEALSIFESLANSGADLTYSLYNSLLDACVECADMKQAEILMERMVASEMADAVSYNTLIKAHLRHDSYQEARKTMGKMQKAGCKPNPVTYNELINALVRNDDRTQVWEVVDEMKANGVRPNKITCSILFRNLNSRSNQADVVRTMELTDQIDEPMDEVLLSSIIEACVRIGKPGLLTAKLEQLQGKNGIKVTGAHTFGSLIKAYGTAHDMDGAWRCWKAMRSQHVKATSITIGCMVEAVASNGDVDGAYELICQLLEDDKSKSQINSVIFGSVLKAFGRSNQIDRLWSAFKEMRSHGIMPSVVTFNTVIDSCVRNNQVDAIEGLLEDMKACRLEPNLITYSTILKGVCQKGDMEKAFAVFKDLKKASAVKPDEIVYNTMLDGCATAGLVAEGEQLLEDMLKDRLTPTNYTLTVLVRLMGQGRRVQRAFEVIETFAQKHKVRANSHVFTALVQSCLTCRDLPRAATAFEQSLRSRIQPDQRVCQGFIRAFIIAGKTEHALSTLRTLLGLPGSNNPALANKSQNASTINDAFIDEVVSLLLQGSSDVCALAPPLVADIRAVRPKLHLEPSTDRSLALAVARKLSGNSDDARPQKKVSNSSSSVDASPQKKHPWSK